MLLSDDFERAGSAGYYYRRAGPRKHRYFLRDCEGCGRPCLVRVDALEAGHGRFCSISCAQAEDRHPAWRGDGAGYKAAHDRVYRIRGKAASCVWGCQAGRYDWANLTGDLLNPDDYAPMCRSCHRRYDGAVRAAETGEAEARRPRDTRWRPWRGMTPDRPNVKPRPPGGSGIDPAPPPL